MTITDYIAYLRMAAQNVLTYSDVSGMPVDEPHKLIFGKNHTITNDTNMLRSFLTKTVSLVTYNVKGGKWIPVGQQSVDFEKLDPIDIKLTADIVADEIEKTMVLFSSNLIEVRDRGMSTLNAVFNDKLSDMILHKQKLLISQENELLATGKITYPFKDASGLIKAHIVDFTAIDGAIATRAYTDSGYVDSASSSITEVQTINIIEKLRKYGWTNSNGALFNTNSDMIYFAGSTAYANTIKVFSTTSIKPTIFTDDNVNYYFKLAGKRIPIVETGLAREYHVTNTTTGVATATSVNQLGDKEALLVDVTGGKFGYMDLRFTNLLNLNGMASPRAYNLEFEPKIPASDGITMFFSSRTMAHGRTKAIIKYTSCS